MNTITFNDVPLVLSKLIEKVYSIESILNNNMQYVNNVKSEELLTINEASELLNLSKFSIYSLVSKRKIPCSKVGKKLYFSRLELIEWIKSGRLHTITEIENNFVDNLIKK